MRRFLMTSTFALPAFAGLLLLGAPAAEAQCAPDSAFCAEVNVGSSFNARVRVRSRNRVVVQRPPPPPVRAAQVIVVQPAQPAPPPPPPQVQPPVVIVQPYAPPPPTATVTVTTTAQPQYQAQVVQAQPAQPRERRQPSVGIHPQISGVISRDVSMFGFRVGPRFRPRGGAFALELNFGFFSGTDYNGLDRVELPIGLNSYLFFNPRSRIQFYAVLGLGLSYGTANGFERFTDEFVSTDFAHFNGEGGLGLEWRIKRWFALNVDVRGLLRHRISNDARPEFTEFDDSGNPTGRSTNTSAGAIFNFGGTFYF